MQATLFIILLVLIAGLVFLLRPDADIASTPVEKVQQSSSAEQPPSHVAETEPPSEQKGEPVTIGDFASLAVGDNLEIFVPQESESYSGNIEDVKISAAGNKSLIGMFDVSGQQYRFVFTIGQQFTFGTLHTPKGRYQLQSQGGEGRLVSVNEINANRDFSVPDYVMPQPAKGDRG